MDVLSAYQQPRWILATKPLIQIVTETGLRIYKELAPCRKEHLDLLNGTALDSGLQDSEWNRGGSADGDCH